MAATTRPADVPQLLLPGQAAAPAGPVDVAAMYLMHRAFRRDLDAFAAVVVADGDRRRWRRLEARFRLFASVLHSHHHGEDVGLWPLLAARGADPDVLAALESEHAGLDPLLRGCADGLRALAAGTAAPGARAELARGTAGLRDALGAHLAHEEREGMALVQRHLAQEDWDRLDEEVFAKEYRPRDVPATLGWIASALTREQRRLLPGANAVLAAAADALGWWAARRDRRVFGRG